MSSSVDARVERTLGARHDRHAGADRRVARRGLAAHQRDRFGRGADERQPGIAARARERRVLGEEAVARMHGVGARAARRVDDRVDAKVALRGLARADVHGLIGVAHVPRVAVAVRVHRDRRDAQSPGTRE